MVVSTHRISKVLYIAIITLCRPGVSSIITTLGVCCLVLPIISIPILLMLISQELVQVKLLSSFLEVFRIPVTIPGQGQLVAIKRRGQRTRNVAILESYRVMVAILLPSQLVISIWLPRVSINVLTGTITL